MKANPKSKVKKSLIYLLVLAMLLMPILAGASEVWAQSFENSQEKPQENQADLVVKHPLLEDSYVGPAPMLLLQSEDGNRVNQEIDAIVATIAELAQPGRIGIDSFVNISYTAFQNEDILSLHLSQGTESEVIRNWNFRLPEGKLMTDQELLDYLGLPDNISPEEVIDSSIEQAILTELDAVVYAPEMLPAIKQAYPEAFGLFLDSSGKLMVSALMPTTVSAGQMSKTFEACFPLSTPARQKADIWVEDADISEFIQAYDSSPYDGDPYAQIHLPEVHIEDGNEDLQKSIDDFIAKIYDSLDSQITLFGVNNVFVDHECFIGEDFLSLCISMRNTMIFAPTSQNIVFSIPDGKVLDSSDLAKAFAVPEEYLFRFAEKQIQKHFQEDPSGLANNLDLFREYEQPFYFDQEGRLCFAMSSIDNTARHSLLVDQIYWDNAVEVPYFNFLWENNRENEDDAIPDLIVVKYPLDYSDNSIEALYSWMEETTPTNVSLSNIQVQINMGEEDSSLASTAFVVVPRYATDYLATDSGDQDMLNRQNLTFGISLIFTNPQRDGFEEYKLYSRNWHDRIYLLEENANGSQPNILYLEGEAPWTK